MSPEKDPIPPTTGEAAEPTAPGEAAIDSASHHVPEASDAESIAAPLDADAFARVLDAGGDPLVVMDAGWRYVYVNGPALPYMRRSREELLGRTIVEVFPEIVHTRFWEVYNRAVREHAFLTVEDYFAPLDTWFDIRVLPHDGHLYLHFHDVTARKRAERDAREAQGRLREAQVRLEAALSAGETATWTFDVVGDRIVADENLARLFCVSPDDAAGGRLETYLQAIHPDDRTRVASEIGDALKPDSGDHFESEYRVVSPEGSRRWLVARGRVERDESGRAIALPGVALDITARKQAEEALRLAAGRLRIATQSANVGIWDLNPVTGVLVWDERCKAAFGLPPDAHVDYGVFLAGLHPEDRERADDVVRAALDPRGTGSYSVEYRTVGIADGAERWILAEGQAYFDSERTRAERFVGTVLDITERKRAETDLRRREERFQAVARATRDAVWDWNLETNTIWWNEGVRDLFGYEAGQVDGDVAWWYEHIHPEDRGRVVHGIHEVIDGRAGDGHSWSDEYRFLRADGGYADILDRGYVLRDGGGSPQHMVGAMLDLTERKRLEHEIRQKADELRVSEARFRVQADAMPQMVWATDPQGNHLYFNRRWYEYTGQSVEESLGFGFALALHPDDHERTIARWRRAWEGGEDYEIEYRFRRHDGAYRWFVGRAEPVRDPESGAVAMWAGTCTDIDDLKRAQEGLRSSADVLREQGEYLRRLVESSPDCIKTLDLDGHVLSMNEGGQQVMQVDDFSNVCGMNWLTFWQDEKTGRAVLAALDAARAGGTGRFHGFCPTFKGEPRWWDVVVVPLLGVDGKPEQLLGVSRDVTEREHLYAQERVRAEREGVLARIGAAIRASLSPADVQAVAVEALGRVLGVGRCYFAAVDIRRDQVVIGRDFHAEGITSLAGTYRLSEFAVDVGLVFGGGRTLVARDSQDTTSVPWESATAAVLGAMRVRALVNVPFHDGRGELVAALGVAMADAPREWSPEEVAFIEQVATETREALEAVRRLQRERTIAEQLQAALQPGSPPNLPGLSLASHYRPALAEAGVGGDFFDVFPVEEGFSALVVADLSGKGLAAAQQVATVRNMLRLALYTGRTVAEAVATLHNALVEHDLLSGFATLFVGVYAHEQRSLTYVNCGQEPGLLWRASTGEVDALAPTGPVLGGFGQGNFTQRTVLLSPGDVMALFTDGLTEVGPSRKELLEIGGLSDLLRECCTPVPEKDRTPQALVGRLIAAAESFGLGVFRDDIALLVGVVGDEGGDEADRRGQRPEGE